jgi:hypothetical protein
MQHVFMSALQQWSFWLVTENGVAMQVLVRVSGEILFLSTVRAGVGSYPPDYSAKRDVCIA